MSALGHALCGTPAIYRAAGEHVRIRNVSGARNRSPSMRRDANRTRTDNGFSRPPIWPAQPDSDGGRLQRRLIGVSEGGVVVAFREWHGALAGTDDNSPFRSKTWSQRWRTTTRSRTRVAHEWHGRRLGSVSPDEFCGTRIMSKTSVQGRGTRLVPSGMEMQCTPHAIEAAFTRIC